MEQQVHLRGVSLDVHWRLVQCQPCRLAVWEGRGPARSRAHTEYALRAEGDGTHFDYRNEFRPPLGPVGALASRALVGGMPEREARRTIERLRELLEDGKTGAPESHSTVSVMGTLPTKSKDHRRHEHPPHSVVTSISLRT